VDELADPASLPLAVATLLVIAAVFGLAALRSNGG
jgi:hypothetical protein